MSIQNQHLNKETNNQHSQEESIWYSNSVSNKGDDWLKNNITSLHNQKLLKVKIYRNTALQWVLVFELQY